jgi:hypothetical protein
MARLPFLLTPQGAALKGKAKGRDRTLLPGCGKPRITICRLSGTSLRGSDIPKRAYESAGRCYAVDVIYGRYTLASAG